MKYALKPEEVLVIDDLKPGLDMARAAIFLRSPPLTGIPHPISLIPAESG